MKKNKHYKLIFFYPICMILLATLFLAACSSEDVAKTETKDSKSTEQKDSSDEVTVIEKNQYINEILDINQTIVDAIDEMQAFTQQTSASRVRPGTPEMEELKSILSPISNDAAAAFDAIPLPPSEDLEEFYKLEAKYISAAQEFANIVPIALESRDSATKTEYKEKLNNMQTYMNQINEVVKTLDLK